MLIAREVSYTYSQGLEAIKDFDLTLGRGEFLAVIGPNASGKSTLAKLLATLLVPTSGTIQVEGIDAGNSEQWQELKGLVGIVFQNPDNQLVAPVVEEDIAFGPENLGLPPAEIRDRVDESLRQVKMEDYRYHAPHRLSGGQKQRVAIAGVLAMRPRYLILDEPTSMLDPAGRREVLATLKELQEEGLTIVLISHFMEEALLAERVLVLHQGQQVLEESPRELFSRVEELEKYSLRAPPINELLYRLRADGLQLPPHITETEELVKALCALF